MLSASARTLRARLAAYSLHAAGKTNTRPATLASLGRFEREVVARAEINGEELTPEDIARRAEFARKAHMTRLAFLSHTARAKVRLNKGAATVGEQPVTAQSEVADDDGRNPTS